jgi:8-oxo-dGTP diphosphatase
MKIEDVEIQVVKGDIRSVGADRIIRSFGRLCDEKKIRDLCARALKAADADGLRSLAFLGVGCDGADFPAVACAKIMAQEIFRYTRETKKRRIKEIYIVLSSAKQYRLIQKIVYRYLSHIVHKLSGGPFIPVDTIIETAGGIVLIKRSNPPFGWAIPGGFVDYGETLEEAARREAREETGLKVKNLRQMHTYSEPRRDPRFHTVTTVFICQAKGKPKAASDAASAAVFKLGAWRDIRLAFDHKKVLEDYLKLRGKTQH